MIDSRTGKLWFITNIHTKDKILSKVIAVPVEVFDNLISIEANYPMLHWDTSDYNDK